MNAPAARVRKANGEDKDPQKAVANIALQPIEWGILKGREPPARAWLTPHWWGKGYVTMLSSLGGIGKTTVALTWAIGLALDKPYLAPASGPKRILFWACEDDYAELWRKVVAICTHFGVDIEELTGKLYLVPRAGYDNTLVTYQYGALMVTPLMYELGEQIESLKVDGVILDNISNLFGGDENNRNQVTVFTHHLLDCTRSTKAGVLLLGHTAKGLGSEFSGSTAWENSARMRLWLTRTLPDQQTGEVAFPGDENTVYLMKRKANYSAHDYRTLTYCDGLFICEDAIPTDGSGANTDALREKQAERIVLNTINRATTSNQAVSSSTNASNYIGKFALDAKLLEPGVTLTHIRQAVARLQADGKIEIAQIGLNASRHPRYGLRLRP